MFSAGDFSIFDDHINFPIFDVSNTKFLIANPRSNLSFDRGEKL